MTHQSSTPPQPGPDLDRRVAAAINLPLITPPGWPFEPTDVIAKLEHLTYLPQNLDGWSLGCAVFKPSTDWNVAMWAAERAIDHFNFYDDYRQNWDAFQLAPAWSGHNLVTREWMCNFGDSGTVAFAPTGPHAICLAILKIKEAVTNTITNTP